MYTPTRKQLLMLISVAASAMPLSTLTAAPITRWITVVNNGDLMPGSTKNFNSYNQPAVNSNGLVVFRARSQGGDGGAEGGESGSTTPTAAADAGGNQGGNQPVHGIYTRGMARLTNPVVKLFARGDLAPPPNNLNASFNEFPSTPRIAPNTALIATRGQTTPVWKYLLSDGTETRVGTSGVFTGLNGVLGTAVNQLGGVPDFSYLQVPDAVAGTKFDQFPGAPSPNGTAKVAFKGNYTDVVSKTGVYYRDFKASLGKAPVVKLANTNTVIPNQAAGGAITFGSTAPPSAAAGYAVFAGFDNEDAPTLGGIYRVSLSTSPGLRKLVGIGDQVPGEVAGTKFSHFGESLSFDGRFVSFWGAWNPADTHSMTLICPADGNKDVIAYCKANADGLVVQVPNNQGIFVHDTERKVTKMVARSGRDGFDTFVYWNFSGKPPCDPAVETCHGDTGSDFEPPRWRSTAFSAVSSDDDKFQVAFKATKTSLVQGIYLSSGPRPSLDAHRTIMETGNDGTLIDPEAPAGSGVTALGIERDGFRLPNLVLTSSMLAPDPTDPTKTIGWAGIYLTKIDD